MLSVSLAKIIAENFYCTECGGWVYCPEMNQKYQDEQGRAVEKIGEGCLHRDEKGNYLECPACKAHFYIIE